MRKFLVSILLFGLIGPVAYLAWSGSGRRANAQSGVANPTAPATASPAAPDQNSAEAKMAAMTQQIQQLQQAMQAMQRDNRVALTLPPELAQVPEDPSVIVAGEDAAAEAARIKIEAALASPTTLEFVDTPLKDIVDFLREHHKIEIQLDTAALKDAGVEPDVPVTKRLKNISLRSALHLVLDDLQLKYVVHNEVLLITSPSKAESDEFMTTRLYPVKDLVLIRNEKGAIEADFQSLQDVITQTIATKTWQENGGNGTQMPFVVKGRCLLVETQTQEVHEEISGFLAALRKTGAKEGKVTNDLLMPTRTGRPVPMLIGAGYGGTSGGTSGVGGGMGGMGGGFPCP